MTEPAVSTTRLEAFSDGVFAIAITLLIIEIKVPGHAEIAALGGLLPALGALWPSYLGYVISFIMIGIMWANHHAMLEYIRRADRPFMLLNVLMLMVVAFVPFSTAVLAEHLGDPHHRTEAALFYGGSFMACGIAFNVLWWFGIHDRRKLAAHADDTTIRGITLAYLMGPIGYTVATALALVNVWASLALHAALALLFAMSGRPSRHARGRA